MWVSRTSTGGHGVTPRQWAALGLIAYEGVAIGSHGKVPTISQLCRRVLRHFTNELCPGCREMLAVEQKWSVPRTYKWQTKAPS